MPTLSDIINPEAFDLKPPRLKFLESATQALNRFLKCLFENNTLKIHELIWEFVMVPDLQVRKDGIETNILPGMVPRSNYKPKLVPIFSTYSKAGCYKTTIFSQAGFVIRLHR
jgi:hypothetical protein